MKIFFDTVRKNELKYIGFLAFFVVAAIALAVCDILITKLTGDISQAAVAFEVDRIVRFLLAMAAIMGVKAVTAWLSALLSGRFSGKMAYTLKKRFARHFTYAAYGKMGSSGENLSLYANDLDKAALLVSEEMCLLIGGVISAVAAFVFMASLHWLYTLIFLLMFPLLVWMQVAISKPIQDKAVLMSAERAAFNQIVNDSLQNTAAIVAYALEDYMEQRYLGAYDRYVKAVRSYNHWFLLLVLAGMAAALLPVLFVYVASGRSVLDGSMTLSMFIAFTTVSDTANSWLLMLSQQMEKLRTAMAGAERINRCMGFETEDTETEQLRIGTEPEEEAFKQEDTAIAFEEVSFSYSGDLKETENPGDTKDTEGESRTLRHVSFTVKKGSKMAIIGPSGSGKSTVLKLLLGLYEPARGCIRISGKDIRGISKESLRRQIAYVPQDCFLFAASIRENITCGVVMPENTTGRVLPGGTPSSGSRISQGNQAANTEQRIRDACEKSGLWGFIESLPDGLDTMLTESAANISGGQKQRIAIARAFYRDAPIVLFDEATSALDPVTETAVLDAFNRLMEGRTAIMVAHRPSAILSCDTVMTMENGTIH